MEWYNNLPRNMEYSLNLYSTAEGIQEGLGELTKSKVRRLNGSMTDYDPFELDVAKVLCSAFPFILS